MWFASSFVRVLLWMVALVAPESVPWGDTYVETATAIVDACEHRPPFGNRERCEAVLVAIAYHESRFDPHALGDAGASYGLFQLSTHWLARGRPVAEQAAVAVELVSRSERICAGKPLDERLGWYASGGQSCGRPASSRIRMRLAASLLR